MSIPQDLSFLDQYAPADLECDGLTRVLHKVLSDRAIPHALVSGSIRDTRHGAQNGFHFWIDLPDGRRVDYRARMWLGTHPHIPHGVFQPADYPEVIYEGQPFDEPPLDDWLFEVLLTPMRQYRNLFTDQGRQSPEGSDDASLDDAAE